MREEELIKAVQSISFTPDNQDRIMEKIRCSREERTEKKGMSKKRILVIALAATMLLGVTVVAASGIITNWYSSSTSKPEYNRLPTQEQCKKDVGYEAILIERFSNGYTFKNGDVVSNQLEDSEGNTAEAFRSLCLYYEKAGDMVIFSQDRYTSPIPPSGEIAAKTGATDIFYNAYRNKFVPGDYQMTEDDKEDEEAGQLIFSYGSEDIKIIDVQAVSWSYGDMHYELMQMDGKLSKKELVEMAKEIIN